MKISAGGALLLAALYFFLPPAELAALLLAAAAHEAGHILALRLCGARVISLRVTATGAVIERSAAGERGAEALCALAGPAAGLLYALAAARLGGETLTLSAGASAALSAFNALPARPLDGWRALEAVAGAPAAHAVSLLCASSALLCGLVLALGGYGLPPLLAGTALTLFQLRRG